MIEINEMETLYQNIIRDLELKIDVWEIVTPSDVGYLNGLYVARGVVVNAYNKLNGLGE